MALKQHEAAESQLRCTNAMLIQLNRTDPQSCTLTSLPSGSNHCQTVMITVVFFANSLVQNMSRQPRLRVL